MAFIDLDAESRVSGTKTLTESSATAFVQVDVAASTSCGGFVVYSITATDGTDYQIRSGLLPFCAVNKAATETGTVATVSAATEVAAVSSGTLTNTFTVVTSATNAIQLAANAVSSLTQTTLQIEYTVFITSGSGTVTPQ